MPPIHIIVAMTRDGIIGDQGRLPWALAEDLQLFRQLTIGQTVLMGRTTYESIGHPLSQRNNIVISRTLASAAGATICPNFTAGLRYAQSLGAAIFCIGGAEIYRQALNVADTLHISWVEQPAQGDRLFPTLDLAAWQETERRDYQGFRYCRYERRNKSAP